MDNNINDNAMHEENKNKNDSVVDIIPESAQDVDGSSSAPYETTAQAAPSTTMAIASLILGIFSTVCCCTTIPSIAAGAIGLVLGLISVKNNYGGRNLAIAGIVLSALGLVLGLIVCVFAFLGTVTNYLAFR